VDCSSINLNTVAKKFQHKWIFRDINATLNREDIISITGSNCSRLNLKENIDLYLKFKSLQNGLDTAGLIDLMKLKHAAHKELRFYSSGMQQRVKLALAICSESSILLLDEPTTNLDKEGMSWYTSTLKKYSQNRLIVIASNEERDFELCNRSLSILDYKKKKQVGLN
jgi:ABC-type multidrug transport system ATPase subunit